MPKPTIRSINHPSNHLSVWLLAAAIGLCPAAAQAIDNTSTATGNGALASESGGSNNTADGYVALSQTTTGSYNTASGSYALLSNSSGSHNTASGSNALTSNTSGSFNTASGEFALYSNTTGSYNTAGSAYALFSNTTGNNNVGLGYQALVTNEAGRNNVAIGAYALSTLMGSSNIALGINAGKNTTSGDANIYIGHSGITGSESQVTRLGKTQTKVFVAGIAGVPLSGANVVVRASGQLGVVASSARYKQDIAPLAAAAAGTADRLAQLRPVSYRYKSEPDATHYGLIAEEVDQVMPELVVRDGDNRPESVQYIELIPLLLQQWKTQRAEIARQRALIERQDAALTELRGMLAARLAALDSTNQGDSGGLSTRP